jgi:hypothetical protein
MMGSIMRGCPSQVSCRLFAVTDDHSSAHRSHSFGNREACRKGAASFTPELVAELTLRQCNARNLGWVPSTCPGYEPLGLCFKLFVSAFPHRVLGLKIPAKVPFKNMRAVLFCPVGFVKFYTAWNSLVRLDSARLPGCATC